MNAAGNRAPWLLPDAPVSPLGATHLGGGRTHFLVWAPNAGAVDVVLDERRERLEPAPHGYHERTLEGVPPGTRYGFSLDGGAVLPDPASRLQAEGVHGASVVSDPDAHNWHDGGWRGITLRDLVLYELHTGTFTPNGTFEAAARELPRLAELGVTAIEIMPVAQFPGTRNWGYDGVLPFAVQDSYGGPDGLKRLVDAAHAEGIGVVLDVVYNHLGPEGNRLAEFGPYYTERYHTPWGAALNFDDAGSDHVRRYFIENALRWIDEFHIDGLRLDAVHAIFDASAQPFLRELAAAVHARARELNRDVLVIAESDLNDPRVLEPAARGGLGMDAQWMDDFHHALHVLLTRESAGYYADFRGAADLARAYSASYVYDGRYSEYRGRRHGAPAGHLERERMVVFIQNHDQVGNRRDGERLSALSDFESRKLAAAAVLLSPFTPLLFMGEEYGETAPFIYFTSHGDPQLVEAVRAGRKAEFSSFAWSGEPPDPQAESTFDASRIRPDRRFESRHRELEALTHELLRLRRTVAALAPGGETHAHALGDDVVRVERRATDGARGVLLLNFGDAPCEPRERGWTLVLDTADARWGGPGSQAGVVGPHAAVLLVEP